MANFVYHQGFGGLKIYHSESEPVILANDVGLLLQQEYGDETKARWVIHVSIYPNQDTSIYNSYWRGLHQIAPGKHFDYNKTRWSYIFEQTGILIIKLI